MRYDDDERVANCQREIQRLRRVVWELEEKNKRLNAIAHNAIVLFQETGFYNDYDEEVLEGLGITEEEYREIMEINK